MTDTESADPDWRAWSLEQWNDRLVDYYFRRSSRDLAIRRIPVTDDELRKIVGSTDADPHEIRQQFLSQIRSRNVERMLRVSHWRRVWNEEGKPPFFAYLFLTCLAASGDEETADVGNFRFRLNEMLSTDCRYMLPELSKLWEYLADWLEADYTRHPMNGYLVLPDAGSEVRIGYSKRLAFPSQRDKNRMIALFHEQGITNDVRIGNIVRLLDKRNERFSNSFKTDLQDFRERYVAGAVNLDTSHFWSAVLHAIAESQNISIVELAAASLVMLSDSFGSNRLFVLLDSSDFGISLSKTRTSPAVHDRSKHVLEVGLDGSGVDRAAEFLLGGELHEHVPLIQASALRKAVSEGVLLFGVDEHGIHEFRSSMPSSGSIQLLLRKELATILTSLCVESGVQCAARDSQYTGWTEILNLSAENLRRIDLSQYEALAEAHCLQAPRQTYRIQVRNGVKSGRAFLGYKDCLPEVRALGADSITLSSLSKEEPSLPLQGDSDTNGEDFVFTFPTASIVKPLCGRYRLTARDREGVLSTTDLTFRLATMGTDYKGPVSGTHRIESGLRSTVLFSDLNPLTAAHSLDHLDEPMGDGSEDEIPVSIFHAELVRHESELLIPFGHSNREQRAVRTTEEICAALAINQSGIKPSRILSLIDSHFPGLNRWDVLRAWVEAGCFDRLTSPRGSTTYIARRPRITLGVDGGKHRGTVTGLTTLPFRNRLREAASSIGCEIRNGLSFTPCLLGPLLIYGPSRQTIADVAHQLNIPILTEHLDWVRFIRHVARVATQNQTEQLPLNYNQSRISWRSRSGDDCVVTRHQRLATRHGGEYRESQDYYAVVHRLHESWTYSKNWAMLTAMSLADKLPFYTTSNYCVVRSSGHHVYLPLPVGRLTALVASAVGGPLPKTRSEATYAYPVLSKQFLAALIQRLFGSSTAIEEQILELLNYHCRSTEQRRFELPRLVKRRLLETCDSPRMRVLVKGKVSSRTVSRACRLVKTIQWVNQ